MTYEEELKIFLKTSLQSLVIQCPSDGKVWRVSIRSLPRTEEGGGGVGVDLEECIRQSVFEFIIPEWQTFWKANLENS